MCINPITTIITNISRSNKLFLQGLLLVFWALMPIGSSAQTKIMPVGDSITHGFTFLDSYRRALWHKLLAGMYAVDFVGDLTSNYAGPPPNPDFDQDHSGIGGLRTYEILPRIRRWTVVHKPDIVLLHMGTNDIVDGDNVEGVRDNLGALIDSMRLANPKVKVLLAQLIPTALSVRTNEDVIKLNELLPALVEQKNTAESPVILVDQHTGFDNGENGDFDDDLHPNARGEEKMAQRWYQALQGVLDGKPLPVSFVQFSARSIPAGIQLQWATASEQNNAGFTIERSLTGTDFVAIGKVAGQGNSTSRHTYSYLDASPAQSVLYYRLRQTDTDGANTFTNVLTVTPDNSPTLVVGPVPSADVITVSGIPPNSLLTVRNMRGQVVYQQQVRGTQLMVDIAHLASGVYVLQAETQRVRFIKQ